jgi:hypothetical protein
MCAVLLASNESDCIFLTSNVDATNVIRFFRRTIISFVEHALIASRKAKERMKQEVMQREEATRKLLWLKQ